MLVERMDACDRVVRLPQQPQRIVCLCPSLTETLWALGLAEQLVGRTRYCIHPQPQIESVASVGGTKQVGFDALHAVQPDLIIAEKEENRREDVEAMSQHWPVYVCDIQNLQQAHAAIAQLGDVCARADQAATLNQRIEQAWQRLPILQPPRRVLYLIWRKPWMAAGRDTYIDAVLNRLGMVNVAATLEGRYPQIETKQLAELGADLCLLSSEPFPFGRQHEEELAPLMPGTQMRCVDGEMFSWYGVRMLPAADHLAALTASLA